MGNATLQTLYRVALQGGTETEGQLRQVGKVGAEAFDKIDQHAKAVPNSLRAVDAAASGVKRTIEELALKTGPLGSALTAMVGPAGLAAAGLVAVGVAAGEFTKRAIESGDHVAKQAAQIGIGSEALQGYAYAAKQTGVEQAQLEAGLKKLVRGIGDAKAGTGDFANHLKLVDAGLLASVKSAHSVDEGVALVIKRIAEAPTQFEKASLAAAAFGRAGVSLIPLANDAEELTKRARELGIVLSDDLVQSAGKTQDKLDELSAVIQSSLSRAFLEAGPAIITVVDDLEHLLEIANKLGESGTLGRILGGGITGVGVTALTGSGPLGALSAFGEATVPDPKDVAAFLSSLGEVGTTAATSTAAIADLSTAATNLNPELQASAVSGTDFGNALGAADPLTRALTAAQLALIPAVREATEAEKEFQAVVDKQATSVATTVGGLGETLQAYREAAKAGKGLAEAQRVANATKQESAIADQFERAAVHALNQQIGELTVSLGARDKAERSGAGATNAAAAAAKRRLAEEQKFVEETQKLHDENNVAQLDAISAIDEAEAQSFAKVTELLNQQVITEGEAADREVEIRRDSERKKSDIVQAEADKQAEIAKRATEKAANEAKRAAEKAQAEFNKPFENAVENIQRDFGDMFTNIFENGLNGAQDFGATLKHIFAKLAGELAELLVIKPILGAITGAGGGGLDLSSLLGLGSSLLGGGTGTGGGGGGGNLITQALSLLSSAKTGLSLLSTGAGLAGSSGALGSAGLGALGSASLGTASTIGGFVLGGGTFVGPATALTAGEAALLFPGGAIPAAFGGAAAAGAGGAAGAAGSIGGAVAGGLSATGIGAIVAGVISAAIAGVTAAFAAQGARKTALKDTDITDAVVHAVNNTVVVGQLSQLGGADHAFRGTFEADPSAINRSLADVFTVGTAELVRAIFPNALGLKTKGSVDRTLFEIFAESQTAARQNRRFGQQNEITPFFGTDENDPFALDKRKLNSSPGGNRFLRGSGQEATRALLVQQFGTDKNLPDGAFLTAMRQVTGEAEKQVGLTKDWHEQLTAVAAIFRANLGKDAGDEAQRTAAIVADTAVSLAKGGASADIAQKAIASLFRQLGDVPTAVATLNDFFSSSNNDIPIQDYQDAIRGVAEAAFQVPPGVQKAEIATRLLGQALDATGKQGVVAFKDLEAEMAKAATSAEFINPILQQVFDVAVKGGSAADVEAAQQAIVDQFTTKLRDGVSQALFDGFINANVDTGILGDVIGKVQDANAKFATGEIDQSQLFAVIKSATADAKDAVTKLGPAIQALADFGTQIANIFATGTAQAGDDAITLERIKAETARTFNQGIDRQLLGHLDPGLASQFDLEVAQRDRLKAARDAGADLVKVEELNGLEREALAEQTAQALTNIESQRADAIQRIMDQVFTQAERAIQSVKDLVTSLTATAQSPLPPEQALAAAQANFNDLAAKAKGGDLSAIEKLPEAGQKLLELAQNLFGSTDQFFALFNPTLATLKEIAGLDPHAVELSPDAKAQIAAINSDADKQIATLNKHHAEAMALFQAMLDALLIDKQGNPISQGNSGGVGDQQSVGIVGGTAGQFGLDAGESFNLQKVLARAVVGGDIDKDLQEMLKTDTFSGTYGPLLSSIFEGATSAHGVHAVLQALSDKIHDPSKFQAVLGFAGGGSFRIGGSGGGDTIPLIPGRVNVSRGETVTVLPSEMEALLRQIRDEAARSRVDLVGAIRGLERRNANLEAELVALRTAYQHENARPRPRG